MVSFGGWLAQLRDLHERARAGQLDPDMLEHYRTARDELERALLIAQQITREYGHTARQAMRMAWALQVDLGPSNGCTRAVTLDISAGGFSTLLGSQPPDDSPIEFSLRIPGRAPLRGTARVVAAIPRPGAYRVSFAFAAIADDDAEQLRGFLFDRVITLLPGSGAGTATAA